MSFKNRKGEDFGFILLVIALLVMAIIIAIVFIAIICAIQWFANWIPATFGWVGILLCTCAVCYLFYKYA